MDGDLENVCVAIYPTMGRKVIGIVAVVCDEERIPTPDLVAIIRAGETPNDFPPTLLKMHERVEIAFGCHRSLRLEICLKGHREH